MQPHRILRETLQMQRLLNTVSAKQETKAPVGISPVRLECRSHLGEYTAKPNLPDLGIEIVIFFKLTLMEDCTMPQETNSLLCYKETQTKSFAAYLKKSAEIRRNTQAKTPINPQKSAEIRRNTQAKTPSKNTPSKNPRCDVHHATSVNIFSDITLLKPK